MAITVNPLVSPRIVTVLAPDTEITIQNLIDQLRDWEDDNLDYPSLAVASGGQALGGGVTVGLTLELQNAQLSFEGRTSTLSNGTATANDSTGTRLTDSAADFVADGIYRGCTIFNAATGALAEVIDVTDSTNLLHGVLSGGTRATWLIGDGWTVYPNVQCVITGGNLTAVDENAVSISQVMPTPNVQIKLTSSSSATVQELELIQQSSFENGVHFDVVEGSAGTEFPLGTSEFPSSNLDDAITIATARGFNTIYVRGVCAVSALYTISGFHFEGKNPWTDHLHTFTGGTLIDCTVKSMHVSGPMYGTSVLTNCRCGSVSSFAGEMTDCVLESGTTTILAGAVGQFLRCKTGSSTTPPSINHGGTGEAHVRDHHGSLTFKNKTGGNPSTADFSSGFANIDATCTGGELKIRGVAGVSNLAAGMKLTTNALLSAGVEALKHTVETTRDTHQAFGERFYVDAINGRDTNAGDSVSSALQTVAAALALAVSGRGDAIYLLAPGASIATFTERVTITKEDIHIRGPGRGVQFQPSTANAGDVITISADNCSLSGFVVRAPVGSTTDNCITVNGKFARLSKLYLVGTQAGTGHGFLFRGGDYHELHNCESEKMGGSGLKTEDAGLSSGSPREISISGGNYYLNNRDGIELTGNPANPTNSTRIMRLLSPNVHNNLRYGVSVDANVIKVDIHTGTSIHGNSVDVFTLNAAETHRDSEWDTTDSLESGMTLREAMRVVTAALAGKLSGAPTGPIVIRNVGDTKNRITAVVDEDGNRTGVTTDVS